MSVVIGRGHCVRANTGPERLIRATLSIAIVGGPLTFLIGGVLAPAVHRSGQATISANMVANPVTNALHLAAFTVASFLLPIGGAGLGVLTYRDSRWLGTIGGGLAVVGWLPLSALTALDDLANIMAATPDSASADLLDRFTTDAVMTSYLIIYIVAHLIAYVLLGLALWRARIVPWWAGWSMITSSPMTVLAFALPGETGRVGITIGALALALLTVGSIPAGQAMLVQDT